MYRMTRTNAKLVGYELEIILTRMLRELEVG